jgi:hypothetical protein
MSGMTTLGIKMKTLNRVKIRQTHILNLLDKGINSSVELEETIRLGKELQENPLTNSSTDTNQTPRGQHLIPMPKLRKCHKSTRTTQISSGQSKPL